MKHGTHRLDLLVPGDLLGDGWEVVDTVGDGDHAHVTVIHDQTGETKHYRLPRSNEVEVNNPAWKRLTPNGVPQEVD